MKNVIICILAILIVSCKTHPTYQKFDYNHDSEAWITAYKDQMFFECLQESYSNDSILKLLNKKDAFNPYDGLGLNDIKSARALGRKVIENIPFPTMCETCTGDKNYYMATCLHYYKSRDLDSIARIEYKTFKERERQTYGDITPQ